ncbi:MAG TPA: molybdopterin-dependent oxidoreductase [Stellaceae bacterium]|jgi:DMSO/TMAO reductase YedYZ molybdopterin-dependent catalytic subunit|nr:molybdopterin-dependent oxidoreductase [Stellaceae bacterium]
MSDSTRFELPPVPIDPPGFQMRFRAPHELVDRVTAERDLFLIAHLGIARVNPATWRLSIGGLVERPSELSFDDIKGLPKRTIESFHQCAGDPKNHRDAKRLVGNVVWGGVDLAELLRGAGIRIEAKYLWAYGLDRGAYEGLGGGLFHKDMPLARLDEGGVMLAYEINGAPLPPERGFPLRLIIPGYYGTNDVKWLCRLELAERRAGGVFTTTLYNDPDEATGKTRPVWEAPPESAIVSPQPDARLPRGPIEIWGWAWAARGVARVEISTDGGASWAGAALEPRSQYSWQRFAFPWTPPAQGDFKIAARAVDAAGTVQRMSLARNAVHTVPVAVAKDP